MTAHAVLWMSTVTIQSMLISWTVLVDIFLACLVPFLVICCVPTLLGRCVFQRVSVVVERKKRVAWRMQEEEIFELSSFELVVVLASLDFDHQGATCFGCWGAEQE